MILFWFSASFNENSASTHTYTRRERDACMQLAPQAPLEPLVAPNLNYSSLYIYWGKTINITHKGSPIEIILMADKIIAMALFLATLVVVTILVPTATAYNNEINDICSKVRRLC
jgi:hypothetical protein